MESITSHNHLLRYYKPTQVRFRSLERLH